MAMLRCAEAGHVPMLTVHDELCFSITQEKDIVEIKTIMENCVPEMKVPSRIDVGSGANWGLAK